MADPWLSRQQAADETWVALLAELETAVRAAYSELLMEAWRIALGVSLTAAGEPPVVDGRLSLRETWAQALRRWVQPVVYKWYARQYSGVAPDEPVRSNLTARDAWWNQTVDRLADAADAVVDAIRATVASSPALSIEQLRDQVARTLDLNAGTASIRSRINAVEARLLAPGMSTEQRDRLFARRVETEGRLLEAEAGIARAHAFEVQGDPNRAKAELGRWSERAAKARGQLAAIDDQLYPNSGDDDTDLLLSQRDQLYHEAETEQATWLNHVNRIARTESTNVMNEAGLQRAADVETDSGDQLLKVWLSSRDERVRPTHVAAHGQAVPLGGKFTVGVSAMDRPGDPTAPIEEVANCRCTLAFLTADELEEIASVLAAGQPEEEPMTVNEEELRDLPPVMWHGVITVENVYTGDGRKFKKAAIRTGPLPMPIRFQREDWGGHTGSVVVANIEGVRRFGDSIRAWGTFADGDLTPEVDEVQGLMATRMMRGVSIDGDDSVYAPEIDADDNIYEVYDSLRVRAATFVAIPAYDEAEVFLGPPPDDWLLEGEPVEEAQIEPGPTEKLDLEALFADASQMPQRLAEYWVHGEGAAKIRWGTAGDFDRCRRNLREYVGPGAVSGTCANLHHRALGVWPGREAAAAVLVAAAGEREFTAADFAMRELDGPTPLTILDDGTVYGHLAIWGTCHTGYSNQCITPPHSTTGYALFHVGAVRLSDGSDLPVGKITIGGSHAKPTGGPLAAAEHYDNSCTGAAVVRAYDDDWGVQLAGRVIPGTPPSKVEELRRSPLSGDWRTYGGNLELIAALGVNVPGFPVPRALVASVDGRQVALIAAGALPRAGASLKERRLAAMVRVLSTRVAPDLREARVAAAVARINPEERN